MLLYLFLFAALAASSELPPTEPVTETVATETVAPTAAPIKITNAIEPSMLAYKHWTGTYSPETFTIQVNGTEVAQGNSYELPASTKTVEVRYDYSFINGMRTGGKTVTYELHENSTQANITFSWQDNWRVLVDNGTAVKEKIAV